MKQRGRKSAAALAVVAVDGKPNRLQPPDHLSPDERRRFVDLVSACDPEHFRASDLPLVCRFVEADALAEQAARELRTNGAVSDGRASPWLVVQEKAVRALTALALRLRLSPQSRTDPKTLARQQLRQGPAPWDWAPR
jgi:phage terminase small subunit